MNATLRNRKWTGDDAQGWASRPLARLRQASRRSAQTLVMALIIMGILMILGVVFIALISQNIRNTAGYNNRSEAYDLAEAGVRYVHAQMVNSPYGLDWRPAPPTYPLQMNDPDYGLMRPPNPADPTDYGGPDKLGPYSRLIFNKGRALVRVRYAPSDPRVFSTTRVGDLFQPGMARDYTIIEAYGKSGNFSLNDPTLLTTLNGVQRDGSESKKLVAFVSCGIIEHARFETNINNVTTPAEIGWPTDAGATYDDTGMGAQVVNTPVLLGGQTQMPNPFQYSAATPSPSGPVPGIPYGGDFYSNADLLIYGNLVDYANPLLGDGFRVAGTISGADQNSKLTIDYVTPSGTAWSALQTANITNPALNSGSNLFSTINGILKDGMDTGDLNGYPRGIPREEPPSLDIVDPDTGLNRYLQLTEYSGKLYAAGDSGQFGFGDGVYVNNSADVQEHIDEAGRQSVGSAESLPYDWLNPNNGQSNSGWQGAFYVPPGALLLLLSDGFVITRDKSNQPNQQYWMEPDGTPGKRPGAAMDSTNPSDAANSSFCRFKLVPDPATGMVYIFNSYSVLNGNVIDVNQVNSSNIGTYRSAGSPFNGVLYFAGNVRVRGQIPTDMQLTVVSGATIYIEGSITKGIANNGTRSNVALGATITSPSKSMLALMAEGYVTLNTTQFFGPSSPVFEDNENSGPTEYNPLKVDHSSISFDAEFGLDQDLNPAASKDGSAFNPSTWVPFSMEYAPYNNPSGFENTNLLVTHTMEDGAASATFINMDVNRNVGSPFADGTGPWQYLFPLNSNNAASPFYPVGFVQPDYSVANQVPLYGLGIQTWQRYAQFESDAFPLVTSDFTLSSTTSGITLNGAGTSPSGVYHLLVENLNGFDIGSTETVGGTSTNPYLISRAAIVPQDVQIDATIYAEQGSFFVIPGPWFNPNPNDTRANYATLGASQGARDQQRLENFGTTPEMPFYGETLDVKISILGAVSENMPPPIGQQAEWLKKWGWIPRYHGASGEMIPVQHVPPNYNLNNIEWAPNITITYDPALATGRSGGFVASAGPTIDPSSMIRYQAIDVTGSGGYVYYALPPIPRLPASPTIAYFGEVNP
ncbi:MAG TPA: pilus assembly PilX N-terminal domain-containing protein [Fimbriimonadaceae bacterium]|nr:pilus assembly PilX N-terminal domain-containing protein [Fimbriimonadaceae bacterium]